MAGSWRALTAGGPFGRGWWLPSRQVSLPGTMYRAPTTAKARSQLGDPSAALGQVGVSRDGKKHAR
jgi:hypothetical protein